MQCIQCGAELKRRQKKYCSKACRGKEERRSVWPSKSVLEVLLWKHPIRAIAKKYMVSHVTVMRWVKNYGITNRPYKGYWKRKDLYGREKEQ